MKINLIPSHQIQAAFWNLSRNPNGVYKSSQGTLIHALGSSFQPGEQLRWLQLTLPESQTPVLIHYLGGARFFGDGYQDKGPSDTPTLIKTSYQEAFDYDLWAAGQFPFNYFLYRGRIETTNKALIPATHNFFRGLTSA